MIPALGPYVTTTPSAPATDGTTVLAIQHELTQSIDVVTITRDVDIHTAPQSREYLRDLIGEASRDVVVDLSQVPVLDSMGLGVLVGALKRARSHRAPCA